MLVERQIDEAVKYNSSKVDKLWTRADLPYPLDDRRMTWREFVAWVCAYQAENKIKVDGKLGPLTYKMMSFGNSFDVDGTSNCLIVDGESYRMPEEMILKGYSVENFKDDGLAKFNCRARTKDLKHFILHETCGNTVSGCENTLRKRNYGVQLIQDHKGCFYQYGDILRDRMVHANQLNDTSFGCEQINPYSPIYVRDEKIWHNRIKAQWWTWVPSIKSDGIDVLLKKKGLSSVPKEYVTLTYNQTESMKLFVKWLIEIGVIEKKFPTIGTKKKIEMPGNGIVAHRDFASHSDGRYMLEILAKEIMP